MSHPLGVLKNFCGLNPADLVDTSNLAHYCYKSRRIFMAVPANTQGSFGTERFWNFWDAQWARAILADQIAGGTGMELGMHKQLLLAALHAVQVTHTTTHIISLNEDR